MRVTTQILCWAIVLTIIFGIVLAVVRRDSESKTQKRAVLAQSETLTSAVGTNDSSAYIGASEETKETTTRFFEDVFQNLNKMGVPKMPTAGENIRRAVDTGDDGLIVRAFHEVVYSKWSDRAEVLSVFREYLGHSDPVARLAAARSLLTMGDEAGVESLLEIIDADSRIGESSEDIRIRAAKTLAKFRIYDSVDAIASLYGKTKDGDLLSSLATLGVRAPQAEGFKFVPSVMAITEYAKIGADEHLPKIESVFEQTYDAALKSAAAWALAFRGNEEYLGYLKESAQASIEKGSGSVLSYDVSSDAVRYLGSIQSPEARTILTDALSSKNPVVVQYAVVNLIFNQPEISEKATQFVIEELRGEHQMLGSELALNIASKLFEESPEVRSAGSSLAGRSGDRSWQQIAVKRQEWPVYSWIDDYVVTLNR